MVKFGCFGVIKKVLNYKFIIMQHYYWFIESHKSDYFGTNICLLHKRITVFFLYSERMCRQHKHVMFSNGTRMTNQSKFEMQKPMEF